MERFFKDFPWLRVLGSLVAIMAGAATLVGVPMAMQSRVDAGQDTRIDQVAKGHREAVTALRTADRDQAADNRKTAEALKAVATIVNEIDKRGTIAGREHEHDREIHQP